MRRDLLSSPGAHGKEALEEADAYKTSGEWTKSALTATGGAFTGNRCLYSVRSRVDSLNLLSTRACRYSKLQRT